MCGFVSEQRLCRRSFLLVSEQRGLSPHGATTVKTDLAEQALHPQAPAAGVLAALTPERILQLGSAFGRPRRCSARWSIHPPRTAPLVGGDSGISREVTWLQMGGGRHSCASKRGIDYLTPPPQYNNARLTRTAPCGPCPTPYLSIHCASCEALAPP